MLVELIHVRAKIIEENIRIAKTEKKGHQRITNLKQRIARLREEKKEAKIRHYRQGWKTKSVN